MVSAVKVAFWFAFFVLNLLMAFTTWPEISPLKGFVFILTVGTAFGFMWNFLNWAQARLVAEKG